MSTVSSQQMYSRFKFANLIGDSILAVGLEVTVNGVFLSLLVCAPSKQPHSQTSDLKKCMYCSFCTHCTHQARAKYSHDEKNSYIVMLVWRLVVSALF